MALATVAFAFQIYGDFSGYSDIARGLAKLLGIDLAVNFRFPYFVRTPQEFWTHWHISLSEWLRDYLFLPLSYACPAGWTAYAGLACATTSGSTRQRRS